MSPESTGSAASPAEGQGGGPERALRTLLVSDLVSSTKLIESLGDARAAELFRRHDRMTRDLLRRHGGLEIDKTDGFLMLFERPLDAVLYALAYHQALRELSAEAGVELLSRVGIHLGEVYLTRNLPEDVARGAKPLEVEGLAKPIAARLMSVASGGQTLLSQAAFDLARRAAVGEVAERGLAWLVHGRYLLKGVDVPVEVFEVGVEGEAPLTPPPDSAKVRRLVGDESIRSDGAAEPSAMAAAARPVGRRRRWRVLALALAAGTVLGTGGYYAFRAYLAKQKTEVLEALNMAPLPPAKKEGRVLVARFENRTRDPGLDWIGEMVADRVRSRLPELDWVKEAVAVRDADRLAPEATAEEMRALAKRSGGDALVAGHYYRDADRLVLHGRVFDLKRECIHAELAPIVGDVATPAPGVEDIAERLAAITGDSVRWAREGRVDVSKFFNFSLPHRLDALQIIQRASADDLTCYRRAYERDPRGSLFALVDLAYGHMVAARYAEADQVLAEVDAALASAPLSPYKLEAARWVRAMISGDTAVVEETVDAICRWNPALQFWRFERVMTWFRANKPRAMLQEFAQVTPGSPGERHPFVWYARALAYFLLDDLDGLESALQRHPKPEQHDVDLMELAAYLAVRRGDLAKVQRLLDDYDEVKDKAAAEFNLYVAVLAAMRRTGRMVTPEFAAVVRRADAWFASRPKPEAQLKETRLSYGEMLYVAGRYAEARQAGERLLAEYRDDVRIRSLVATAAARLGDVASAQSTFEWLRRRDQKYTFGYTLFAQAKIQALLGQPDQALRLLRESFAQYSVQMEKDFSWEGVLLGPDFESLRGDPRFQEFIRPKG